MLKLNNYSVQEIENLKDLFPNLNHHTRYNRIRRNLGHVIDTIPKEISKYISDAHSDILIMDSIPIPVCGFG